MPTTPRKELNDKQKAWIAEQENENIVRYFFKHGWYPHEIKEWMENEYDDLDADQQAVFDYLFEHGGISDPEDALYQTKNINCIGDRDEYIAEAWSIPQRLRNYIDYDYAWKEFEASGSYFEIKGTWYQQED
jgi:hypothetical protein